MNDVPLMSRGGSRLTVHPQVQFRNALLNNNLALFQKLITNPNVQVDYVYDDNKTCLEIAASEENKIEFVKCLLEHNADVNKINEITCQAPIHCAVENGNIEVLNVLLQNSRIDVNLKYKQNTALLLAIKDMEELDEERDNSLVVYEDMIEALLKAGCNPTSPDAHGVTPIHSAAKQGLENVINMIIDHTQGKINLDQYKDVRGRTARQYIEEAFPHLLSKFHEVDTESEGFVDIDQLFAYLYKHEENKFINDIQKTDKNKEQKQALSTNINTMLILATKKGLSHAVQALLERGADPKATYAVEKIQPIEIACQRGYYDIFMMFVTNLNRKGESLFSAQNHDSLLHHIVKGMHSVTNDARSDHKHCLEFLLKHVEKDKKINVNQPDIKNNTALHYAARNGDHDIILELLRNGACVGLRNKFDEPPLADISAKTLESYLDECIETNDERPTDDNYEIHIKYNFLVYPNDSEKEEVNKPLMNGNNSENQNEPELFPETDALLYMSRHEELRPLLKHPVITSFLYMKWQRVSCLFHVNFTFYSLLWLCLTLYIILGYGDEKKQTDSVETFVVITHIGAIIGLIILILRELFQFLVFPSGYILSIENWIEVVLIIVIATIVSKGSAEESTKQQLSAVAILLSSAELVLLIGQFPTFSTNIVMLRTVSWNFFKFLLWYFILILAFALSFYTLFREVRDDDQTAPDPNKAGKGDEEEEDFFKDPGRSLFKTIVMLTGEFDAGSIKFSTFPLTSHILFIVFVFMIPIVLFNLLNGLAVSDTQEIRANAELVGHISRIKLLSHFENVIIGNSRANAKLSRYCAFFPPILHYLHIANIKTFLMKPISRRISLFPYFLPKYKIVVKPNRENMLIIPDKKTQERFRDYDDDIEIGGTCLPRLCCNTYYFLDKKIIKNAKYVISKKTKISGMQAIERKIDYIDKTLKKILKVLGDKNDSSSP